MNIGEALKKGRETLKEVGIDTYALDARVLLKAIANISDSDIISNDNSNISDDLLKLYFKYIEERAQLKPVSKILGVREFWGLEFKVNEHVLDPRSDTENLIERVLEYIQEKKLTTPKILDLGTGSGCIPISLAHELPKARFVTVDSSPEALKVAKHNAEKLGVSDRIEFIEGDWAYGITEQFDIVTSNPPYVAVDDPDSLAPELKYDPIQAWDGGKDGNDEYRKIFSHIFSRINPQGVMFLEIGFSNLAEIRRLCDMRRVVLDSVFDDLAGRNRVLKIVHGEN